MNTVTQAQLDRGVIVHREMLEKAQKLASEGFEPADILAGLAALMNDLVTSTTNQAAASAYFFGLAKTAAQIAASQLDS